MFKNNLIIKLVGRSIMNVYITFILLFITLFSQFSYSCELEGVSDSGLSSPKSIVKKQEPSIIFLVRHAEKMNFSKDPELSEYGKKRALELANILKDTKIEYVHSSNYKRTRTTAAPTAKQFGLEISIYDPRELKVLAREVKFQGGTHLIVGHSNTTPELATLLGGDAVSPINDAKEFDRLYIVTVTADDGVSSILMRYGKAYNKN